MTSKPTFQEAKEFWKTTHAQTSDDIAAVCFPSKSPLFNSFFDSIQRYALSRALKNVGVPLSGARLLDVGCGRGRWLDFYRKKDLLVTGIDFSREAVIHCKKKHKDVFEAHANLLPFQDSTFDVTNSITVLQHLPRKEQAEAAKEIERVTRRGGTIVLLENTFADPSPHVWSNSLEEWQKLFPNSLLEYAESHYYGFLLRTLWRVPYIGNFPQLLRVLENAATLVSYPLEFALMALNKGKHSRLGCLQHVMVLRRGR